MKKIILAITILTLLIANEIQNIFQPCPREKAGWSCRGKNCDEGCKRK